MKNGCAQRDEFRERIAGLGLRSATFNCDILAKEIRPGRRIKTMQTVALDFEDYNDTTPVRRVVKATIIGGDVSQFACVIDPGQISDDPDDHADGVDLSRLRFRKSKSVSRITEFLDEPDLPVCDFGNIVRDGKCERLGEGYCCKEVSDELAAAAE